ncbi:CocE/NonD family hydrolase [Phenylobacterium sp.]|uniref:CocE/NonD family hydrolase n=1 Tax=Phenylobacterium sp. TaxID=1871053 RepID=UPI0035B499F4
MKRYALVGAALAALVVAGAAAASASAAASQPASAQKPEGWSDKSYYVAMPDGVKLAVSLWFPGGRDDGVRRPAVLIQTRYGRAGVYKYGEAGRYRDLVAQGYVLVVVDTRGSTASFGDRLVELSPEEIKDMDALIAHVRAQDWSNGEVFATGVSYMADTADLATGSPEKLTGAVIRESDFDGYLDLFAPGGVANDFMMSLWGGDTVLRDYGKSLDPKDGLDCGARAADCPKLWPRMQAVDADPDFALVREAIAKRRHWKPDDYRGAEFRDDKGANGYTMFSSSPAARLAQVRREATPVQYWASWMDAGTADGTLARYRSLPTTPMEVWITANNHGGEHFTDPFFPGEDAPEPSFDQQWRLISDFLDKVRAGKPVERAIHYYVLGAKTFKTTADWPPAGVKRAVFNFGPDGSLTQAAPAKAGQDLYAVDFDATSGKATRWTTQIGDPAAYADRREADKALLSYTSAPFEQDMELVGGPSVRLFVATATADPAFFAYLEDVGPDGRATYLTEGLFRAVNRKPAGADQVPYAQAEPIKTYSRADAMPMTPGVVAEVSFPVFPVAALIRKGHRLRISLAGADKSAFRRYSEDRPEAWTVMRTPAQPSSVSVDLRPWSAQ